MVTKKDQKTETTIDIESTDITNAAAEIQPQPAPPPEQKPPELTEEEKKAKADAEFMRLKRVNELAIAIDEKGVVKAKNNSELIRYCGALVTSEMVPARFDKPDKLFGALMFVRSLGLPDIAIRQTAVIHGTPSLFGDLPLALCQATGELFDFDEIWFDKDYKEICFDNKNLDAEVFGARTVGRRGKTGKLREGVFTMKDAEKAGLYPAKKSDGSLSPKSPWNTYTKMMLRYKARSIYLKSDFADKTNGVGIGEYDFDQTLDSTIESMKDVTPANGESLKDKLNREAQEGGSSEVQT